MERTEKLVIGLLLLVVAFASLSGYYAIQLEHSYDIGFEAGKSECAFFCNWYLDKTQEDYMKACGLNESIYGDENVK